MLKTVKIWQRIRTNCEERVKLHVPDPLPLLLMSMLITWITTLPPIDIIQTTASTVQICHAQLLWLVSLPPCLHSYILLARFGPFLLSHK